MQSPVSADSPDSSQPVGNDDFIKEIVTCFVCEDFFTDPKVLPKCGHILCLSCIERSLGSNNCEAFTCPKCTIPSPLSPGGPKAWVTCVQLIEVVKSLKRPQNATSTSPAAKVAKKSQNEIFCNHYQMCGPPLVALCPHCNVKFCKICMVSHLESMKNEAISKTNALGIRLNSVTARLDKTIGDKAKLLEDACRGSEAIITQGINQVLEAAKWDVDQMVQELLNKSAGNVASSKIAKMQATFLRAKESYHKGVEIASKAAAKPAKNVSALEELSALYGNMCRLSFEVEKAQELSKAHFEGPITFDQESVKNAAVETIEESIYEGWQWTDIVAYERSKILSEAWSKLHEATKKGDFASVKEVLTSDKWSPSDVAKLVSHCDETDFSRSLLHQAAASGNLDIVRFLVEEKGASIDALDSGAAIPVYVAAFRGYVEIVRYLLPKLKQFFPANYQIFESDTLRFAVMRGHPKIVEMMVTGRDDLLNQMSETGETWLHRAASCNQLMVVDCLVTKGIHTGAVDFSGNTALHPACQNGFLEVAALIADADPALVFAKNRAGQSPFDLATAGGYTAIVDLFCERFKFGDSAVKIECPDCF